MAVSSDFFRLFNDVIRAVRNRSEGSLGTSGLLVNHDKKVKPTTPATNEKMKAS